MGFPGPRGSKGDKGDKGDTPSLYSVWIEINSLKSRVSVLEAQ